MPTASTFAAGAIILSSTVSILHIKHAGALKATIMGTIALIVEVSSSWKFKAIALVRSIRGTVRELSHAEAHSRRLSIVAALKTLTCLITKRLPRVPWYFQSIRTGHSCTQTRDYIGCIHPSIRISWPLCILFLASNTITCPQANHVPANHV
jgi:hypothetical protein